MGTRHLCRTLETTSQGRKRKQNSSNESMAAKTTDPIDILLEMGIDLDNLSEEEDYLSALMEAANTLTIKDASDPRIAPLQQEILKLRKKRFNKARPEVKKTTIKPENLFERKVAPKQKKLPTSAIVPYKAT